MEIIHPEPIRYSIGQQFGLTLLSDFHIGSADADYAKIESELAAAADRGDRIAVNGDVFDLILPGDRKRYRPDALHPRLQGRADIVNAAVEWAEELLAPVAERLVMVGEGNHESMAEKVNSVNATRLLVDRLHKYNTEVKYGGYTGFLDYRFVPTDRAAGSRGGTGHRFVVFYHHGAGGGGIGAAVSQFPSLMSFVDADLIWVGHRHHRITTGLQRLSCPLRGDEPRLKTVRYAMSGSYLRTYRKGALSYGAEKLLPPQDQGGVRVVITCLRRGLEVGLHA